MDFIDLEGKCASLGSAAYYNKSKCYSREGLEDVSKNPKCTMLENGRMLTSKPAEKLKDIVEHLKMAQDPVSGL